MRCYSQREKIVLTKNTARFKRGEAYEADRKKLGGLVSLGILTLTLTACTGSQEEINETVANNLYSTTTSTMETLVAYDNATMEQAIEENPNMDDFTKSAFQAWMDSSEELGVYIGFEDVDPSEAVRKDGSNYVVDLEAEFENGTADVQMVYDSKLNADSIGFSMQYTMGEKMQDAAMNAVVGLGTVFIVLFFLVFVISLFKYIPGLVDSFGKKKTETPAPAPVSAAPAPAVVPAAEEEEVLTDDLELVAVIAAAIAASENTSPDSFVVRSIRKSKKNNWR